MKRIVIAGSINMDIVSRMDRLPIPGQGIMGETFQFVPGGKGANQAVAASRLGGEVIFLGRVGKDHFGRAMADFLRSENMKIKHLGVSDTVGTGACLIFIDKVGTNMMAAMRGANFDITPDHVRKLPIRKGDIIVSTLELPQPTTKFLFQRGRARSATIILNAAPELPASKELLAMPDYLIINEHELVFYNRERKVPRTTVDQVSSMKKLRKGKQAIILTLGDKGLLYLKGGHQIKLPAHKVKAVDTTGASDCFVGAFAVALAEGRDITSALEFANAAASVSVQKFGASSSLPPRQQVEAGFGHDAR